MSSATGLLALAKEIAARRGAATSDEINERNERSHHAFVADPTKETKVTKKVEVTESVSSDERTDTRFPPEAVAERLRAGMDAPGWPEQLPGLGARRVGPFDPCTYCGVGIWVRYGPTVLCRQCARRIGAAGDRDDGPAIDGEGTHAATYGALLRRMFAMIAAGPAPSPADCLAVDREAARLADELGPRLAGILRAGEARVWSDTHGACPYCATPGVLHDRENDV